MKRTRGEKERWEDFEARVGIKRSGGGKKETHKVAPNDILVQRMSSTAKRDFRMEHSEMHFVLLPWTKTLRKPNGW